MPLCNASPFRDAMPLYVPSGIPNEIPVPISPCHLGGTTEFSLAYRSLPAALSDPLLGLFAFGFIFRT